MNPRIAQVIANDDYTLTLTFTNGESRKFDVSPYLDKGIFQELAELPYCKLVKPALGTVQWPHGQDFCPDTLYEESYKVAAATE
jgi:hypothetical protein